MSCVVGKDLVCHDHDPEEEDGAHEGEGEDGLPRLTCPSLSVPKKGKTSTPGQHWGGDGRKRNTHMLCCSIQASVFSVWPVGFWLKTARLQLLLTLPVGPHSSMETTMSPTIHSTNSMKPPIRTIDGRSRRVKMRKSRMPTKTMATEATVMK